MSNMYMSLPTSIADTVEDPAQGQLKETGDTVFPGEDGGQLGGEREDGQPRVNLVHMPSFEAGSQQAVCCLSHTEWTVPQLSIMIIYNRVILSGDNLT